MNLALSEVDHALTEGSGWPGAGIRIALLSGALLGFVAYLSGAPIASAIADLGIGGAAAVLCFEARRSAERSVRRHREAIDALVATVFGEPERSPVRTPARDPAPTRRRRRA